MQPLATCPAIYRNQTLPFCPATPCIESSASCYESRYEQGPNPQSLGFVTGALLRKGLEPCAELIKYGLTQATEIIQHSLAQVTQILHHSSTPSDDAPIAPLIDPNSIEVFTFSVDMQFINDPDFYPYLLSYGHSFKQIGRQCAHIAMEFIENKHSFYPQWLASNLSIGMISFPDIQLLLNEKAAAAPLGFYTSSFPNAIFITHYSFNNNDDYRHAVGNELFHYAVAQRNLRGGVTLDSPGHMLIAPYTTEEGFLQYEQSIHEDIKFIHSFVAPFYHGLLNAESINNDDWFIELAQGYLPVRSGRRYTKSVKNQLSLLLKSQNLKRTSLPNHFAPGKNYPKDLIKKYQQIITITEINTEQKYLLDSSQNPEDASPLGKAHALASDLLEQLYMLENSKVYQQHENEKIKYRNQLTELVSFWTQFPPHIGRRLFPHTFAYLDHYFEDAKE